MHALPDSNQPQRIVANLIGVETRTVIIDVKHQPLIRGVAADLDMAGLGVAADIGAGLLHHSKQLCHLLIIQAMRIRHVQRASDAQGAKTSLQVMRQRLGQAQVIEQGRSQFGCNPAGCLHPHVQRLGQRGLLLRRQAARLQCAHNHLDAGEDLPDLIVHLS